LINWIGKICTPDCFVKDAFKQHSIKITTAIVQEFLFDLCAKTFCCKSPSTHPLYPTPPYSIIYSRSWNYTEAVTIQALTLKYV